ncbi:MAG: GWxTD domain-containing protein [Bacteroidota bacterium]
MVRSSGFRCFYRQATCLVIVGWWGISGCGGTSDLTDDTEGVRNLFESGIPQLEIQAGPAWEGNSWGIALTVVYTRSTLVFARDPEGYQATSQISVQLIDREDGRLAAERIENDTVLVGLYHDTQDRATMLREMFLPARPGSYLLKVSLQDGLAGKRSVAQRSVAIPDFLKDATTIGLLSLRMGTRDGDHLPVPSFRVAADYDSLRFVVDVSSASPETTVILHLAMLRCLSDTTIALPPHGTLPIGREALVYQGVDQSLCDTVLLKSKLGKTANHWTRVSFSLPQLAEGVYRLEITLADNGEEEDSRDVSFQSRDLLVFCPGFPRPSTIDELIRPLVYLASEEEWDSLRTEFAPAERQRRFEAFWLSGAENRQRARDVIKQYYSRVEEANRMFSSHKEGWKTDRGMVYIICGPPTSSERMMNNETWYYPQDGRDAANAFRFHSVSYAYGGGAHYNNIVLQRSEVYRQWWEKLVWRWKNGIVQ